MGKKSKSGRKGDGKKAKKDKASMKKVGKVDKQLVLDLEDIARRTQGVKGSNESIPMHHAVALLSAAVEAAQKPQTQKFVMAVANQISDMFSGKGQKQIK